LNKIPATLFFALKTESTSIFPKGQISSWGEHCNGNHVEVFKRDLDGLLLLIGYEKDYNWKFEE